MMTNKQNSNDKKARNLYITIFLVELGLGLSTKLSKVIDSNY